jgi:periplasmic copper chaperone A
MHRLRVVALGLAGAFVAFLALASAAAAHVTVTAPGATRGGGDQAITFRVPVEKDVNTVAVTIAIPTSTPIASVDVAPIAGWTHTQKTETLPKPITTDDGDITTAVTQVTWTAGAGQGLKPGEYGSFTILAGQLPDVASISFKALQTYADGSVVRWIETAAPGSTDQPEHPAPVLTLAAASSGKISAPATAAPAAAKATTNTGPVVLSIVALVLAAAALGLAVVTRARGRAA